MRWQTSAIHRIPFLLPLLHGKQQTSCLHPSTGAVSAMVIPKHQSEWKATLWGFFFFLFPCKSSHKLLINKRGYSQENQTKSLSYYLGRSQIIHHRHRPINAALSHTSQEGWLGAAKETKETLLKQPGYRCQSLALKKMNIILSK